MTADLPAHLAATAATLSANALKPSSVAAAGHEIEIVALRLREGNLRRHLADARAALALQRQTVLRSGEQQE